MSESYIIAFIAALPGLAALLLRRKSITIRAESEQGRRTVSEFTMLYQEARQQVVDCRTECSRLWTELRESQKREQGLELRVESLEDQVRVVTIESERLKGENVYLSRLVNKLSGGAA